MFENLRCTNKILAQQLDALLKVNANQAEQLNTQAEQLNTQAEQLNAQTELLKQQADELARQSELLAKQSAQIKALLQKIDELTGGPKDSHNSSKPPSSDGYAKKPAPKSLRKSTGKKQGGQPGHKGSGMKIEREPDEVIQHYPVTCKCCPNRDKCSAVIAERRYEYDIVIEPKLYEHQQMKCVCPTMGGTELVGAFPAHIKGTKQYGVNITALASALSTVCMVSIDRIHRLLQGVFGAQISPGTIRTMLDRLTDATTDANAFIKEKVKQLPLAHVDETGWRVAGALHWMHCACDADWSFFAVDKKRGSEAMDRIGILPGFTNLVLHDCWAPYDKYTDATHALCGAHVLRECVYMNENLNQQWADEMKFLLEEILHQRHELETAGVSAFTPEQLDAFSSRYDAIVAKGIAENPIPERVPGQRGRPKKGKIRALLERLQSKKEQFLRFASNWNVPFTNNEAERSIRFSKVKLKVSGCFRTVSGAEDYASVMSYISTASKHGVNYFEAVKIALNGGALELVKSWE